MDTVLIISLHDHYCGLDDREKYYFYDSLISVAGMFEEPDVVVMARDVIGHVGDEAEDYKGHRGNYGVTWNISQ